MLEAPKSLASLRCNLLSQIDFLNEWKQEFQSYPFADDIRLFVELLHLCHYTALACVDDDYRRATDFISRTVETAIDWKSSPSGRHDDKNYVHDYYGGTHDDNWNAVGEAAESLAEELSDWEFVAASARANHELSGERFYFDPEATALLSRMRALRACAEVIIACAMEQKAVTQAKAYVAQYEIAAWEALL